MTDTTTRTVRCVYCGDVVAEGGEFPEDARVSHGRCFRDAHPPMPRLAVYERVTVPREPVDEDMR